MSYETTTVSVSRSQEQIRDVLRKHRASSVNFGEEFAPDGGATIGVNFVYDGTRVVITAAIKPPLPQLVKAKVDRARSKTKEQIVDELIEGEARRMWRVLHWSIKTRMEAVTEGLEVFEQAFLAHILDPGSQTTLWSRFKPLFDAEAFKITGPGLRALEAGS